jgi:hypothetical protein
MPILTLDQVTSVRVKRLDSYWHSKVTADGIPTRSDIDPSELCDLLPYLIITDIEQHPFRVRYRLSGTNVQQYDEELTGQYLDDLKNTTSEEKVAIAAAYRGVVETAKPYYSIKQFRSRVTGNLLTMHGGIGPCAVPSSALITASPYRTTSISDINWP